MQYWAITKKYYSVKPGTGRKHLENLLLDAVYTGNINLVKRCIEKGVNPNVYNDDHYASLHIVAETGDLSIFFQLMRSTQINIDIQTEMGITPLIIATSIGRRDVVQALLKKGANPNITDKNLSTALHYACKHKNMGIVFDLVQNNATVSVNNAYDQTPLSISTIDEPSMAIARYLLRKGARQPSYKNMPILLEICLNCNTDERLKILDIVLTYGGIDINRTHPHTNKNCLHIVAMTGYLPLAKYLLSRDADLTARDICNRTPIDVARKHRHYAIVDLFQEKISQNRIKFLGHGK